MIDDRTSSGEVREAPEVQHPGENRVARTRERERLTALVAVAVALVSLLACTALAAAQIAGRSAIADHDATDTSVAADDETRTAGPGDDTDPDRLVENLPDRIPGFRTAARHNVPGFEGEMAEAIYTPTDEEVSVRTPLNCYVVVKSVGPQAVEEELERVAAGFPQQISADDLDIVADDLFAARDRSTFVIAWRTGSYVVVVDTRFTMATPVEQDDLLEIHGEAVAAAVSEAMRR